MNDAKHIGIDVALGNDLGGRSGFAREFGDGSDSRNESGYDP